MLRSLSMLVLALGLAASACGGDNNNNRAAGAADDDAAVVVPSASRDASVAPRDSGGTVARDAGGTSGREDAGSARDAGSADASSSGASALDASTPGASSPDAAAAPPPTNAVHKTVSVGGVDRTYQLYVPRSLAGHSKAVPLVSVHHGFTMSGTIMETLTTWKAIAERERFVVVFPDGGGSSPWNVGEGVCNVGATVSAPASQDDFGFVKAIVSETSKQQPIDASRVFVGGFSMGGYFANHIGCNGREIVRAVSAHSGGTYSGDCPGEPVPVLLIHGDSDTLIPYQCGSEAHDLWVQRNGCQAATTTQSIKEGECLWNQGCPSGKEVGFCTMKGMDHGWAGAEYTGSWLMLQYGGGSQYENAAELMWSFFAKYL